MVEQALAAITRFQANSPWTDYARGVLPLAEDTELAVLEERYQQEQAKLAIAMAHLQAAKAQRQVVQQDTSVQQGELLRQITEVEEKLGLVGVVRSPYGGAVKSLKWLEQTDQELQVELNLSIISQENQQIHSDKQSVLPFNWS